MYDLGRTDAGPIHGRSQPTGFPCNTLDAVAEMFPGEAEIYFPLVSLAESCRNAPFLWASRGFGVGFDVTARQTRILGSRYMNFSLYGNPWLCGVHPYQIVFWTSRRVATLQFGRRAT